MNLPETPGLQRRLAYAKLVREAHFPAFYQRSSPIEYEIYYNLDLDDVKVGLINNCIVNKTSVAINYADNIFCVICQEHVSSNVIVRILSCSHTFHLSCIDKWFGEHTKCPTCNKDPRED